MKCQVCQERRAIVTIEQWDTILGVCAKCRRSICPTSAEEKEDEEVEERRVERNAEFGSVGDYW